MYSAQIFLVALAALVFSVHVDAFMRKFGQMYVTDFHISQCDPDDLDPITLENVEIQIGDDHRVQVSGTLIASEDLIQPISAAVILKKNTWFGWMKIACVDNVGSCNFEDVCDFGYPEDTACPREFKENKVPCRCPIKKGTYTLPPSLLDYMSERSVLSGKYKGSVVVNHFNETLSCHNFYFSLKDK